MDWKVIVILLFFVNFTTSNAPYCFFKYINLKIYDYGCEIDSNNEDITDMNHIWGWHEGNDGKHDRDVKILTINSGSLKYFNSFSSIFCEKFPNLQIIDMSEAKVSTVSVDSFSNCPELLELTFYKNQIREIHKNIFKNNEKLIELHLSYNKFTSLPEELFKNQENLETLDLSGSYLKFLPARIFWFQSNLRILELDYNNLDSLNPSWFRNLRSLQELDLTNNRIAELPENVFSSLENLKILKLKSNKITAINSNSFGNHPTLKIVSLESNPIFSIDRNFILNNQFEVLNLRRINCTEGKEYKSKAFMLKSLKNCFDNFANNDYEEVFPFAPLGLDSTSIPPEIERLRSTTEATTSTSITTKVLATTKATEVTSSTSRSTTAQMTSSASTTVKTTTKYPRTTTTTESPSELETACGIPTTGQALIVGGENFDHGSYPWMAILVNMTEDVVCGGVLISQRKVLTAGHCIISKSSKTYTKDDLKVVLGSHNLSKENEESRVSVGIEIIKVHNNWNPAATKYDSDIAVVVLNDEIHPEAKVAPICLPSFGSPVLSINNGRVIGFGKTGEDTAEYSKIAKQAKAPIQKLRDCFEKYEGLFSIASSTTFCGGFGNGTGACTGDSGGGLFVSYKNVYYLRGLVSSSLNDHALGCNVNAYSLYTNVTMFIKWIKGIKPSEVTTRGSSITPWSPKRAIKPTTVAPRTTLELYNDLPIWGK